MLDKKDSIYVAYATYYVAYATKGNEEGKYYFKIGNKQWSLKSIDNTSFN